ncbi:hypothetical protein U9M48_020739 [Paspalum notatum var. saurae]|uniref:TATA element modulatory factor 1 TATA binding domain-containing protein n=1 Tax=Paspalum notatum var. saurae TaxID=547442 RepID=A0AAQ3TEX3_PASNO
MSAAVVPESVLRKREREEQWAADKKEKALGSRKIIFARAKQTLKGKRLLGQKLRKHLPVKHLKFHFLIRQASLESIRNSLAEELVKMTEQCEKLRTEAAAVPGLRAELEALKQRHFQALELMGERDEELEELRNDIVDLKEMYREEVDLLVSQL